MVPSESSVKVGHTLNTKRAESQFGRCPHPANPPSMEGCQEGEASPPTYLREAYRETQETPNSLLARCQEKGQNFPSVGRGNGMVMTVTGRGAGPWSLRVTLVF